jgi:asparagine synthase (glutamine-hydrolysing)
MATEDGRFVICYNGEVYNFVELARSMGLSKLRSHSDTEVVLRAFEKFGTESAKLLNGMFAIAVYDRVRKTIWLARDRLGIKPLYYNFDGTRLTFASEIEALLAVQVTGPQCDISKIHEWVYFGTTLGEKTLYRGIQRLLPGHYLEVDLVTFKYSISRYWSPRRNGESVGHTGTVDDRVKETRERLDTAVRRQLVSDVPVGVFLSGGIDSSAIVAFASRHYSGRLSTYTAGFDFDKGINELARAKRIAGRFGTNHHELHVSGYEIGEVVERMVEHHGMPFSDAANIPLYLLSSQIRGTAKVIMQGDGGDEMFGGYSRYTTLSFIKAAQAAARVAHFANGLTPRRTGYYRRQRYINALRSRDRAELFALLLTEEDRQSAPASIFDAGIRREIMRADPFSRYRECELESRGEDPVNQMLLIDAMVILPDIFLEKVDRSTMAASIEVRVPFLDNDLVEFCLGLTGPEKVHFGQKKWLLKRALRGIVPEEVLKGRKTGFGVPYGYWLRGALKPLFFDHLETFVLRHPQVLDRALILKRYKEHESGERDRSFLLWKILNFVIWANRTSVALA